MGIEYDWWLRCNLKSKDSLTSQSVQQTLRHAGVRNKIKLRSFGRELSANADCDSPRGDKIKTTSQLRVTSLPHFWSSASSSVKSWYKYPEDAGGPETKDTEVIKKGKGLWEYKMTKVLLVWALILGLPFTTHTEWDLGISHLPLKNHILCLETEIHLFLNTNGRTYLSFSLLLKISSSGPLLGLPS